MTFKNKMWRKSGIPFIIFIIWLCPQHISGSRLLIRNNGYEKYVVAIHPEVPENQTIIDEIRSMFTEASGYLHVATRSRAFLRNVTILIPHTWKDKPEYKSAIWEQFVTADLRIDKPNPLWGDNPYTKQTGSCGDKGDYTHLTPDFVLDNGIEREYTWGSSGRVVVHEFAHLRYGVFDEYGLDSDGDYPFFYVNEKGRTTTTGCTTEVRGYPRTKTGNKRCQRDLKTRLPEKDCRFFPDLKRNSASGSIMFFQFIDSVKGFCEADATGSQAKHNQEAPNQQNKMCNGKGTWDVISESEDFLHDNNPPNTNVDTTPNFRLVYQRKETRLNGDIFSGKRVVFIMDLSGSMTYRMFKLRQTGSKLIKDVIPLGTELGMVVFSTDASIWRNMTIVKDNTVKNNMADDLPEQNTNGATAIGQGVLKALELLRQDNMIIEGSIIVLITDGEENVPPMIDTVLDDVISSGVVFHTIAYSRQASGALSLLSTKTGGTFTYYSESISSTALEGAIARIAADMLTDPGRLPVEIARLNIRLTPNMPSSVTPVYIDSSIGKDTLFAVSYPNETEIQVAVIGPSKTYTNSSPEYKEDTEFGIVRVQIPNTETGEWTMKVTCTGFPSAHLYSDVITVTTRSHPRDGVEPITVKAKMNKIEMSFPTKSIVYADVRQGYSPVVNANVTALVERPSGDHVTIVLRDNGQGADSVVDDGVYSAYFTQFNGDGKYSVDAVVKTKSGASIKVKGSASGGAYNKRGDQHQNTSLVGVGRMTRKASAGGFNVTGYIPGVDVFPPGRITNFRIVDYSLENGTFALTWTAPGDDYDYGTVAGYELRCAKTFAELRNNFRKAVLVDTTSLTPFSPGSQQHFVARIPKNNHGVYILGIRAHDDASNYGALSNLEAIGSENSEEEFQTKLLGGIIGGTLGGVALICATVLIVAKMMGSKGTKVENVNIKPKKSDLYDPIV